MKMPFGQYRGKELKDIKKDDPSYILWLYEEATPKGNLLVEVEKLYEDLKFEESNSQGDVDFNAWIKTRSNYGCD